MMTSATRAPRWSAIALNDTASRDQEVSLTGIATFVLWVGCVLIGIVGFVLPYARPAKAVAKEIPIQAEMLQVELTRESLPNITAAPATTLPQPPSTPQPLAPAQTPPMTLVAEPTAVAFALPVDGPVSVVPAAQASFARSVAVEPTPAPAAAPVVQQLTYGEGQGKQPAPEYPLRARREGQEGSVGVRFSVGADGRVLAAELASPSPWSLLNDAAVRVVRERWRFPEGPSRRFEVSIRFQLTK